jgi:hypothetical protein
MTDTVTTVEAPTTGGATTTVKTASIKSGWKTTEFWVSALAIVGLVASSASAGLSEKYAAIGATISAAAYAISRGLAKFNVGS